MNVAICSLCDFVDVSPEPSSGSGVSTYNAKHDEICDLEKTVMGLVVTKEERKKGKSIRNLVGFW